MLFRGCCRSGSLGLSIRVCWACRSVDGTRGSLRFFSRNSSSSSKWIEVVSRGGESRVLEVGGFGVYVMFRSELLWLSMNCMWYEE